MELTSINTLVFAEAILVMKGKKCCKETSRKKKTTVPAKSWINDYPNALLEGREVAEVHL